LEFLCRFVRVMPISGFYLEEIAQNCEEFLASAKSKIPASFDFYGT